jgi:hypothetical protein
MFTQKQSWMNKVDMQNDVFRLKSMHVYTHQVVANIGMKEFELNEPEKAMHFYIKQ